MPTTTTPSRSRPNTPTRPPPIAPAPLAAQPLDDQPDGKHCAQATGPAPRPRGGDVVHWHPWPAALIPPRTPPQALALAVSVAAAPDPPAAEPPSRPWEALLQEWLYRATDRMTFRGALVPLLSMCAKWAVGGKAGPASALAGWTGPAIASSFLQLLAGACLPGDREHGFRWMGTLLPSADLAPPPSVARWQVYAPAEDQDLLRRVDDTRRAIRQGRVRPQQGLPVDPLKPLEEVETRLHQRLLRNRDWLDLGAALAMFSALAADVMAAAAAQDDLHADRMSPRTFAGLVTLLMTTFVLDAAAGLWQMQTRRPRPEDYPRPAAPPPLRDGAPAAAPSPPAARRGDAPSPAAGHRRYDPH